MRLLHDNGRRYGGKLTLIIVDVWRSVSFLIQRCPSTILHTCHTSHDSRNSISHNHTAHQS